MFKAFVLLSLIAFGLVTLFGVVGPMLVSAASTEAVVCGIGLIFITLAAFAKLADMLLKSDKPTQEK